MSSSSLMKSVFMPGLASAAFFILAVPVGLAIVLALWLTAVAAYENVRFAHSTDQLLFLIGTARKDAASDAEFGQTGGEDIVDDLVRRAQLLSVPVNGWGGGLRAQVVNPSFMRIETELPVRACRRLGFFFGKDASALKLQKMEAREEGGNWTVIYDAAASMPAFDSKSVDAACGQGYAATLALTTRLRE